MSFVLLLGGPGQNGRLNRLERALKARGRDVCLGHPHLAEGLFSGVGRTLVDHCDVVAGLELAGLPAASAAAETARYGQSRGKLLAIVLSPDEAAQSETGESRALEVWPHQASQLGALCDAIEEKAQRLAATRPEGVGLTHLASAEYAAYLAMRRRGDVEAIARFLRAFPGGMFEDLVRAELDAATRPDYVPRRPRFANERDDAGDSVRQGWRLGGGWLERLLEPVRAHWPWLSVAAVAALLVVAANTGVEWPRASSPRAGSQVIALTPPAAGAQPSQSAESSVAPVGNLPFVEPNETFAASAAQPQAAPPRVEMTSLAPAPVEGAPFSRSVEQASTPAPLPPAPTQTAPPPPLVAPAAARVAYDLGALDGDARRVVERARQNERRARDLARGQSGLPHRIASSAGVAGYQGEWTANAANGFGAAVWANGSSYAGAWRGSRPHGYGVLVQANGQQYEGEFEGGAPSGRGVFWGADGRPLAGDRLFAALLQARGP